MKLSPVNVFRYYTKKQLRAVRKWFRFFKIGKDVKKDLKEALKNKK